MNLKSAVAAIEEHGMLLIFPIDNRPEPRSVWSVSYPKSKMRWEWDEDGDDRVHKLWHLRAELSASGLVVYTKWYQGRATVFSRKAFTALLAGYLQAAGQQGLSAYARTILDILISDSPQSTKSLRRETGLTGKANEAVYERALKELWARLLIVGFGEIEEGAFPSLAMGASKVLFEDLYAKALGMSVKAATAEREALFTAVPLARKYYEKTLPGKGAAPKAKAKKQKKAAERGYIEFEDL
jgi:hypothetical protein